MKKPLQDPFLKNIKDETEVIFKPKPNISDQKDSMKRNSTEELMADKNSSFQNKEDLFSEKNTSSLKENSQVNEISMCNVNLKPEEFAFKGSLEIEEIASALKEALQSQEMLSEILIKTLKYQCEHNQLNEIFVLLSSALDSEEILKFNISLISAKCTEKTLIASKFFSLILLPKFSTETCEKFQEMFKEFASYFPQVTSTELPNFLRNGTTKIFQEFLNSLDLKLKKIVLRDFIMSCQQLESVHFKILEALMIHPLEKDVFEKILELFQVSQIKFTSDKMFGKILVTFIKASGNLTVRYEEQVQKIISVHKTIWKVKAENELKNSSKYVDFLSQSLMY